MPYQYKQEPLSDDEVNRLTNTCDALGEKFVIWTLLGTDLMVSSLGGLWQQSYLSCGMAFMAILSTCNL
jgi:integrase/recombinase XerD